MSALLCVLVRWFSASSSMSMSDHSRMLRQHFLSVVRMPFLIHKSSIFENLIHKYTQIIFSECPGLSFENPVAFTALVMLVDQKQMCFTPVSCHHTPFAPEGSYTTIYFNTNQKHFTPRGFYTRETLHTRSPTMQNTTGIRACAKPVRSTATCRDIKTQSAGQSCMGYKSQQENVTENA